MTHASKALFRLSIATLAGGAALFWNGQLPLNSQSSLMSSAEARIGRPLTPMSYAGVARRTTRRAVAAGAVVGGAAVYAAPVVVAPAPVVAAPRCAQLADAYGRIVTVCR
jgi:hypothetical protein